MARLQDELAREILKGLIGESRWDETLARTRDQLEKLGDETLAELRAGRHTSHNDYDNLLSRL